MLLTYGVKKHRKNKNSVYKAAKANTPILVTEKAGFKNGIDKITEILMKEFNKNEVIVITQFSYIEKTDYTT